MTYSIPPLPIAQIQQLIADLDQRATPETSNPNDLLADGYASTLKFFISHTDNSCSLFDEHIINLSRNFFEFADNMYAPDLNSNIYLDSASVFDFECEILTGEAVRYLEEVYSVLEYTVRFQSIVNERFLARTRPTTMLVAAPDRHSPIVMLAVNKIQMNSVNNIVEQLSELEFPDYIDDCLNYETIMLFNSFDNNFVIDLGRRAILVDSQEPCRGEADYIVRVQALTHQRLKRKLPPEQWRVQALSRDKMLKILLGTSRHSDGGISPFNLMPLFKWQGSNSVTYDQCEDTFKANRCISSSRATAVFIGKGIAAERMKRTLASTDPWLQRVKGSVPTKI
jgi:hypothetical protein